MKVDLKDREMAKQYVIEIYAAMKKMLNAHLRADDILDERKTLDDEMKEFWSIGIEPETPEGHIGKRLEALLYEQNAINSEIEDIIMAYDLYEDAELEKIISELGIVKGKLRDSVKYPYLKMVMGEHLLAEDSKATLVYLSEVNIDRDNGTMMPAIGSGFWDRLCIYRDGECICSVPFWVYLEMGGNLSRINAFCEISIEDAMGVPDYEKIIKKSMREGKIYECTPRDISTFKSGIKSDSVGITENNPHYGDVLAEVLNIEGVCEGNTYPAEYNGTIHAMMAMPKLKEQYGRLGPVFKWRDRLMQDNSLDWKLLEAAITIIDIDPENESGLINEIEDANSGEKTDEDIRIRIEQEWEKRREQLGDFGEQRKGTSYYFKVNEHGQLDTRRRRVQELEELEEMLRTGEEEKLVNETEEEVGI